jgi:hypothetical protein
MIVICEKRSIIKDASITRLFCKLGSLIYIQKVALLNFIVTKLMANQRKNCSMFQQPNKDFLTNKSLKEKL